MDKVNGAAAQLSLRFARLCVRVAHRDYWLTDSRPKEWLLIEWPQGQERADQILLSSLPHNTTFPGLVDFGKLAGAEWQFIPAFPTCRQKPK